MNPSFEQLDDTGMPLKWRCESGRANATFQVVDGGRTGGRCLKVTNPHKLEPHIFGSLVQLVNDLEPDVPYTISFYMKSADCGVVWFGGGDGWRFRRMVKEDTTQWTRISATFTFEERDLPFLFRFNTDSETDEILLDDFQLEPESRDADPEDDFQLEEGHAATEYSEEQASSLKPGEGLFRLFEPRP